jgi:hypothetical protein
MKRRFFVGGPRVLGQSGLAVSRLAEVAPIRQASQVQITAPSAADRSGAAWGRRRGPRGLNGTLPDRVTLAASRRFGLGARQLEAGRSLRLVGTASASGLPAPQPASGTMGLGSGWGQRHRRSGGPPCRWRMLGAAARRRVAEAGHLGSRGAGWPCYSTSTPAGGLCHHRHLEYSRALPRPSGQTPSRSRPSPQSEQ